MCEPHAPTHHEAEINLSFSLSHPVQETEYPLALVWSPLVAAKETISGKQDQGHYLPDTVKD